jgi:hypothetical protein
MRIGWLVVGASVAFMRSAAADETPDTTHVVELFIAASDSEAPAVEKVARELLLRLDVTIRATRIPRVDPRVVVTPDPAAPPAVARVWLDLSGEGPATLYVVDAPWERVLVRHLPPASDEVTREAAAHILETAVDALLRGEHLGIEREKVLPIPSASVPAAPSVPAKPPPRPNLLRGEVLLSYEAQLFGPGPVVRQGPELSVGIEFGHGRFRPGALVTFQYRFPAVIHDAPVGLTFDSVATRALGVLDVALDRRTTLRLGLGGALELDQVTPHAGTDPAIMIGPAEGYLIPVARLCAGVQVAIQEHVALDFGFALDLDFTGTRYLAMGDAQSVVDFAPWPVRPALSVGVAAR